MRRACSREVRRGESRERRKRGAAGARAPWQQCDEAPIPEEVSLLGALPGQGPGRARGGRRGACLGLSKAAQCRRRWRTPGAPPGRTPRPSVLSAAPRGPGVLALVSSPPPTAGELETLGLAPEVPGSARPLLGTGPWPSHLQAPVGQAELWVQAGRPQEMPVGVTCCLASASLVTWGRVMSRVPSSSEGGSGFEEGVDQGSSWGSPEEAERG